MRLADPNCAYPAHRQQDWAREGTERYVCGVCHAPPGPWASEVSSRSEGFLCRGTFVPVIRRDPSVLVRTVPVLMARPTGLTETPLSGADAREVFAAWRSRDGGWVIARIITLARIHDRYLTEMLKGLVDATVASRSLKEAERTGLVVWSGEQWTLSVRGLDLSRRLRKELGNTDSLPGPRATSGDVSRDGRTVQATLGFEMPRTGPGSALLQNTD